MDVAWDDSFENSTRAFVISKATASSGSLTVGRFSCRVLIFVVLFILTTLEGTMFSGLDFFTGVDFEDTLAFVAACGGSGADQDRTEEKDGLELHGECVGSC